jgi:hypothetical protein
MQAYIIASERSGMADILPNIFPGATIEPWEPLPKTAKGKPKAALEYVDSAMKRQTDWIPYAAIRKAVGINDPDNFRMRILSTQVWEAGLQQRGLSVSQRGRQHGLDTAGTGFDDVENLSQIWAVALALVRLALPDDQRSQKDKEPPWKRIAEEASSAM